MHENHAVKRGILGTQSAFAVGLRKSAENLSATYVHRFSPHRAVNTLLHLGCTNQSATTSARMLNFRPLLHPTNSPLSSNLLSSLPSAIYFFRLTLTERTSGYCLGTETAVNPFPPPPRNNNTHKASHYVHPPSSPSV
jgi:hypothetical protein